MENGAKRRSGTFAVHHRQQQQPKPKTLFQVLPTSMMEESSIQSSGKSHPKATEEGDKNEPKK
jgi:hypothetical protein